MTTFEITAEPATGIDILFADNGIIYQGSYTEMYILAGSILILIALAIILIIQMNIKTRQYATHRIQIIL